MKVLEVSVGCMKKSSTNSDTIVFSTVMRLISCSSKRRAGWASTSAYTHTGERTTKTNRTMGSHLGAPGLACLAVHAEQVGAAPEEAHHGT